MHSRIDIACYPETALVGLQDSCEPLQVCVYDCSVQQEEVSEVGYLGGDPLGKCNPRHPRHHFQSCSNPHPRMTLNHHPSPSVHKGIVGKSSHYQQQRKDS